MAQHQRDLFTVQVPRLMPYLCGIGVLLLIVGTIFPEKEIWGGIIAGAASIAIWLFTYVHTEFKEKVKIENFNVVVWTELRAISRVLFDEAKVWDKLTGNRPTGDETQFNQTERRIVAVFELATIQANLDKLSDLRAAAAEGVILVLGQLRALAPAVSEVFEVEDKLLRKLNETTVNLERSVLAGQMTMETQQSILKHDYGLANQIQYENRIQIIKLLVTLYGRAMRTAELIDQNGTILAFQRSSISAEACIEQEKEEAEMHLMYAQYRKLGEWTEVKTSTAK